MRIIFRLSLFLLLFAVIAIVTSYLTFVLFTYSRNLEVPDLKGKSLLEANSMLSGLRLYLKIEGEDYDTNVPPGYILRQDAPPGNKIKEGRSITVVLSKGPHIQYMPDFRGLTIVEAQDKAAANKLHIGTTIEVHSETIEKGTVISQRPAPDEKGARDLSLLVSAGGYGGAFICPDFRGQAVTQARQMASSQGLRLKIDGTGTKVNTQSPPPGSVVKEGDTVSLTTKTEEEDIF